jgi:hypothetical protein
MRDVFIEQHVSRPPPSLKGRRRAKGMWCPFTWPGFLTLRAADLRRQLHHSIPVSRVAGRLPVRREFLDRNPVLPKQAARIPSGAVLPEAFSTGLPDAGRLSGSHLPEGSGASVPGPQRRGTEGIPNSLIPNRERPPGGLDTGGANPTSVSLRR